MAPRREAPVLRALMDDLWSLAHGKKPHPKASLEGDRRVIRQACAELRALLAVARAAKRAESGLRSWDWPDHVDLCRALARVDALSVPSRKPDGGGR